MAPRVLIDAQLPPALSRALASRMGVDARHVFDLEMTTATDRSIFDYGRAHESIVVTKDSDFVHLLQRFGPPPRVVLIALGNLRRAELVERVLARWPMIQGHLDRGEPLIEVR